MLSNSRVMLKAAGQQARLGAGRWQAAPARLPAMRSPPTALAPRAKTFKTESSKLRNVASSVPSGSTLGASAGLGGLLALMQANPFTAQVTIATCKTSLADIIVQKRVEGAEQIDWRRNMLFIMFGGAYLGLFQWFVYVRLFQRLFPAMDTFCNQTMREKLKNKEGIRALLGQIALDFTFVQPFLYFPVFYSFKTLLDTDPEVQASLANRFSSAFAKWRANLFEDNFGMCAFWLPMDLIIYSVPIYLRLPLNHAVSFIWCCILSIFRGDDAPAVAIDESA
ncbi:Hypothetical Protein FCC1311_063102 [Hondaea fermentalgiana]|uniref:Protein SYM1 n=1 Tax=Hondaea fermentalgiana TaxID=2315210 RepID=A0A2R5GGU0_9STRA|nr:Hypothetical Protein FCC1311_063102 [Hondaea fermentalgiana]|eukprot:GBG30090.1 Hypothetical Protein FCC1311_063102 [Hondaea fermentalgiana]